MADVILLAVTAGPILRFQALLGMWLSGRALGWHPYRPWVPLPLPPRTAEAEVSTKASLSYRVTWRPAWAT